MKQGLRFSSKPLHLLLAGATRLELATSGVTGTITLLRIPQYSRNLLLYQKLTAGFLAGIYSEIQRFTMIPSSGFPQDLPQKNLQQLSPISLNSTSFLLDIIFIAFAAVYLRLFPKANGISQAFAHI